MSTSNVSPEQSEVLQRVIEAAPQVHRRHQFFVWSQGDFQRWISHNVCVCGSYDRDQRALVFDVFNSIPIPERTLAGLKEMRSDLLHRALHEWKKARYRACRVPLGGASSELGVVASLTALGYEEVLAHGIHRPGRPEEIESFFMFTRPAGLYPEAMVQAVEMLLPCLHVAYLRVAVNERQMVTGRASSAATSGTACPRVMPITEREREILVWVRDGLSNQQISEKLGISALTVKNHVQKILRKLGAANRAQAVAKAITMNALSASSHMLGDTYSMP